MYPSFKSIISFLEGISDFGASYFSPLSGDRKKVREFQEMQQVKTRSEGTERVVDALIQGKKVQINT